MGAISTDVKPATHRIALQGSTVHIGHLDVSLDDAAEYMRGIPAEKWELAFVHAVQVGMAEILARRRRFQMDRQAAPTAARAPRAEAVTRAAAVTPTPATVEPESRRQASVAREAPIAEEKVVQPRISPPLEPRMETAGEHSSENRSNVVRPQLEPDGWLRRLDEDFEILDQI